MSHMLTILKLTVQRPATKKIATGFAILLLFWMFFIHYNDTHHVSVSRNLFTGEIKLDTTKGIKLSPAWVQVIKFDTRPIKVCIDCSCSNINCKLIAFNPKGWQDFINREGFKYFWFKNRLSFNSGQETEYRGIKHVLRGYAYDKHYSFITEFELID